MAIDKIGTNGLVASAIVPPDGSISTAKIANDAVTSAKIGVDVIAAEDLANNSVTVAELSNNAVTTAKIAANAVTAPKISDSSLKDKYWTETWGLTVNYYDDLTPFAIGEGTANTWALSTEYANSRHASFTNSQRMLTPGHVGGGDTMHSGGGVTGTQFFQFPENGIYSIRPMMVVYGDGGDGAIYLRLFINQDTSNPGDSNFEVARFYGSVPAAGYYGNCSGEAVVKITDYVNDTFSIGFHSISANDYVQANPTSSAMYESHIVFQRLGDV